MLGHFLEITFLCRGQGLVQEERFQPADYVVCHANFSLEFLSA
jgi:hypothetical protein